MRTDDRTYKLIDALNENIRHPFFVLDTDGNIISFNDAAGKTFNIAEDPGNIFDLIDDETAEKLNQVTEEAYKNGKPSGQILNVSLKSGTSFPCRITVNHFHENNTQLIFCSFIKETHKFSFKDPTSVSVTTDDPTSLSIDEKVVEILHEIKALFPFSFIGMERIRAKINSLECRFWISNEDDKLILVNNKFSSLLGLSPSQIEGKNYFNFIPPYLLEVYSSVQKYIKETKNTVLLEGVLQSGMPENRLLSIPLLNSENDVIAVVRFTQDILSSKDIPETGSLLNAAENILSNIYKPAVLVDINGIVRHSNKEFCKLLAVESGNISGRNYSEILPFEISEKVKYFLNSPIDREEFEIESKQLKKNYPGGFKLQLSRIESTEHQTEGIIIVTDAKSHSDDLEFIINSRGRMFDVLIKNNPEPIFIYDTENLRFLEVNNTALALYGYRRDEFLQMDLTDLYTPEDIQTLLDSSVKENEGKFVGPYKHKKKDGSSVYVEISKVSFVFNNSDAHFNIIREISDKLELEKKNQLFKAVFDNTDDLLFVTDAEGFITFINRPVLDLLGYTKNEIEKSSFTSLVRNEERATVNTSILHSHIKDAVSFTMELKKSNGEFVELDLTATPVLDYKNEVDSFSIVGKNTEKNIVKEVVVEKQPDVNITGKPEVNTEENEDKAAFLGSVFHELLTPINVILGFVQELTDGIENPSPDQKEASDIINQNRISLLNTMNSIVEYVNIQKQAADLKPEEIAITKILDELQIELNEITDSKGIDLGYGRISSSLKFESDKEKFTQLTTLLLKIVTNISREKKVYFSSYQYGEDQFILSMKDNYSSVSKHLLTNLSALFSGQDLSKVKDFGISKFSIKYTNALLSLLHGRFEIISDDPEKPDYGFIFPVKFNYLSEVKIKEEEIQYRPAPYMEQVVEEIEETAEPVVQVSAKPEEEIEPEIFREFRRSEEEEYAQNEIQKPEPVKSFVLQGNKKLDLSQLSCLYIEDQVDSQILFKVQMKELKEIKFAVSFEEALPLLDSCHFDFIVMDINLQGEYNGLDALKIIHKMPNYESIPIVAVTAYVLPGDKEKFIATGFNDFISKPIFREKMIDALEKIFLMQV